MKKTFSHLSMIILFCCFVMPTPSSAQTIKGWTVLGDAKWKSANGVIESEPGAKGFLVSEKTYVDVKITLEFWNEDNFSGVFLRCSDPKNISRTTAYKVNINRDNPDNPDFVTGGVSGLATPSKVLPNLNKKWNTYEITVKGKHITVKLNGTVTVDADNDLFKSGPIALQSWGGVTKFKNIVIKPL